MKYFCFNFLTEIFEKTYNTIYRKHLTSGADPLFIIPPPVKVG